MSGQTTRDTLRSIASQIRVRSMVYEAWGLGGDRSVDAPEQTTVLLVGGAPASRSAAAEIIAADLGLNLHKIDLSSVVSKYIGETEKNLRRLFDAAEDGGALLFFDEADALFGKRSEVRDSHDRYANIEVNHLLKMIAAFPGVVIVATAASNGLPVAWLRSACFLVMLDEPEPAD